MGEPEGERRGIEVRDWILIFAIFQTNVGLVTDNEEKVGREPGFTLWRCAGLLLPPASAFSWFLDAKVWEGQRHLQAVAGQHAAERVLALANHGAGPVGVAGLFKVNAGMEAGRPLARCCLTIVV